MDPESEQQPSEDDLQDLFGLGSEVDDLDQTESVDDEALAAAVGAGDDAFDFGGDLESEADDPPPAEEGPLPIDEAELSTSSELDFSQLSLTAAQALRIAPIIAANTELEVIQFANFELKLAELREEDELEWDSEEFTDLEAIIISQLLLNNTELKRLDLARNQISDAGAIAIADMLRYNTSLEYLNLESNVVADRACEAFIRALQQNTTLQYLNLMYNAIPGAVQQELREIWSATRQSVLGLHLG